MAAAACLAACAGLPGPGAQAGSGPQRLTLVPGGYRDLAGWSGDDVAAALPAFLQSCARFLRQPDDMPLDPEAQAGDFGRVSDWRPLCREAASIGHDDRAARRFFEANFVPVLAGNGGDSRGLFTGYWQVEIEGARTRHGPYRIPVYRPPPDLAALQAGLSRGTIDAGALAGRGLAVAWLISPYDLLSLQTQGSGRIRLEDGSVLPLVYAGNNGRPMAPIDHLLLAAGAVDPAGLSARSVARWMARHPAGAARIAAAEPGYVFFRELGRPGPIGAEGAPLTPGRSLAVDERFIPLGVPLWLDAHDRYRALELRHLVVAQDRGDGISGPVRGDFYWGSGAEAANAGGDFYADGHYYLLLPRQVVFRALASR